MVTADGALANGLGLWPHTARYGHAAAHQACLAHVARDIDYAVTTSDEPVPRRLQLRCAMEDQYRLAKWIDKRMSL